MAMKSVIKGWECEDCKVNRNTVGETRKDCICSNKSKMDSVEKNNEIYWSNFWNK